MSQQQKNLEHHHDDDIQIEAIDNNSENFSFEYDDYDFDDDNDMHSQRSGSLSFEVDDEEEEDDDIDDNDNNDDDEDDDDDDDDDRIFKSNNSHNSSSGSGSNSKTNSALFSINNNDNIKFNLYSYSRYTIIQFAEKVLFKIADEISSVLHLSRNQILYLLIYFKWNTDTLMEKYMDKYGELLTEVGIPSDNSNNDNAISNSQYRKLVPFDKDFVCPICCDDAEDAKTNMTRKFALQCGHYYCENCYKHYINDQIPSGTLIQCPEADCKMKLQLEDIDVIFKDDFEQYAAKLLRRSAKSKRKLKKKQRKQFRHYHPVSFGSFIGDSSSSSSGSSDSSDNEEEYKIDDDDGEDGNVYSSDANGNRSDNESLSEFEKDDADGDYYDVSDNEEFQEAIKEENNLNYHKKSYTYLQSVAQKYIESHKNVHWCPAPDCNTLVQFNDYVPTKEEVTKKITQLPIINCVKDHNFCVLCKYENHFPVPCFIVERWVEKCNNDSETAHWINLNTKPCPKCQSSIEKNGGCNHMTCNKCTHQFCWICSGPWNLHANEYYKCNRYNESASVESRNTLDSLKKKHTKYLHYFDRFQIHQVSMNQDLKIYEKISKKIRLLQRTQGISWIEGQFLKNSISTLLKARNTLKWSYAFSYYLSDNRNNSGLIFEQNQTSLSNAVEDLSKLFEISSPKQIIASKLQFIQKARFCVSRQLSLISCAEEGMIKDGLAFDVNEDNDALSQVKKKGKKKS